MTMENLQHGCTTKTNKDGVASCDPMFYDYCKIKAKPVTLKPVYHTVDKTMDATSVKNKLYAILFNARTDYYDDELNKMLIELNDKKKRYLYASLPVWKETNIAGIYNTLKPTKLNNKESILVKKLHAMALKNEFDNVTNERILMYLKRKQRFRIKELPIWKEYYDK